uniref:Uncharacterized protein n=1 Tax=Cuerna arida TaxID=1464854 RepID=A0A1B6GBF0_9HEMI
MANPGKSVNQSSKPEETDNTSRCDELEEKIYQLREDNKLLRRRTRILEEKIRRCDELEEENDQLREDNKLLRRRTRILETNHRQLRQDNDSLGLRGERRICLIYENIY